MIPRKIKNRLRFVLFIIYFVILVIILKLIYLQVYKYDFFSDKSQAQTRRLIKIQSHRGTIFDRNGRALALNVPRYSIYAVPPKIKDALKISQQLSAVLGLSSSALSKKLQSRYPFVWVKRKCTEEERDHILDLEIPGVYFLPEEKRHYPNDGLLADVLGFVGTDGGLGGLEYYYDRQLSGSTGTIVIEGDPKGVRLVSGAKAIKGIPKGFKQAHRSFKADSFDGSHIYTTIDSDTQYMAEYFLKQSILKNEAEKGQVIVMDPHTGEVIAMVDYPSFNPNTFYDSSDAYRKNSAVVDVFEPGSVFKVLTYAAVLEEGLVTPGSVLEVPESIVIGGEEISEAHDREEGESDQKTASEIIEQSLNVGTALLAQPLGKLKFYKYIRAFGFGSQTTIDLPGESPGLLRPPENWEEVDLSMISFGQGVGVTSLQLASMMSVVANDGFYVQPRLIHYISDYEGVTIKAKRRQKPKRVISIKTARELRQTLAQVVTHGTARGLRLKEYSLGGKTGTAQIAGPGGVGYLEGEYVSSFVGLLPVDQPKFVIVVNIHSPKKSYYGSTVAGPVFKNLSKFLIQKHSIVPTRFSKTE